MRSPFPGEDSVIGAQLTSVRRSSRSRQAPVLMRLDRLLLVGFFIAGIVVTLVVRMGLGAPVRAPWAGIDVALETTVALTTLAAALLMFGRFLDTKVLSDIVLAAALAGLAAGSVASWSLTVVNPSNPMWQDAAWALAGVRAASAVVLAVSSMLRAVRVPDRSPPVRWLLWSLVALCPLGLTAVLGALANAGVLPQAAAVTVVGNVVRVAPTTAIDVLVVVSVVGFAVAAAGFVLGFEATREPFRLFMAAMAASFSLAHLNFALLPVSYLRHLYLGDLFRLVGVTLLFAGILNEVRLAWHRKHASSIAVERKRLAGQLHDGATQDVAFIAATARDLAATDPRPELQQIVAAAERALEETRYSIFKLTYDPNRPLDGVLVAAAEQVAYRMGARLRADCQDGIRVGSAATDALSRIVRESVLNAVRHGNADVVDLRLRRNGRQIVVTIQDNGRGFDPGSTPTAGYGLAGMRERAAEVGGTLTVSASPGQGTRIEVTL